MKKLGRNEKCHCGSDKKYKRCCLKSDMLSNKFNFSDEVVDKFVWATQFAFMTAKKLLEPQNISHGGKELELADAILDKVCEYLRITDIRDGCTIKESQEVFDRVFSKILRRGEDEDYMASVGKQVDISIKSGDWTLSQDWVNTEWKMA